ncbi:uncharacterized protein LOC131639152 [Vicia villosa]|uniref:uncharacterized protein LOC131639152 n=1 Tax=Vicia villosa TaxID=3911 RepID=UPI00273B699A|nr:uncharacterized protein LOC131639152 [Vicia villosa]
MEMLKKIHVNIPFCEALEHMPIYANFMKELLLGKRKLKDDENIALAQECRAIIKRKLPLKLTNPGANINLMSRSMMRKLKCSEPKLTHITLTLVDRSITHPYGIIEDVLVRVDNLVFPTYFVILDMPKDLRRH